MALMARIYHFTKRFPSEKRYGLTEQMRRATVSVPCNIAEGAGRQTRKEFINILHIAQGSLSELDTLRDVAVRLKYVSIQDQEELDVLMERLAKTLSGLIRQQRKLVSSQ
jgi:four helix bundle protein